MDTPRPCPISVTSDLGVDEGIVTDFVRDLRYAGEEAAAPNEPGEGGARCHGGHVNSGWPPWSHGSHLWLGQII